MIDEKVAEATYAAGDPPAKVVDNIKVARKLLKAARKKRRKEEAGGSKPRSPTPHPKREWPASGSDRPAGGDSFQGGSKGKQHHRPSKTLWHQSWKQKQGQKPRQKGGGRGAGRGKSWGGKKWKEKSWTPSTW